MNIFGVVRINNGRSIAGICATLCLSVPADAQTLPVADTVMVRTIADALCCIERNNPTLRLARQQGCTNVLEARATNALPETELEYSPFFTRGVSGMSSSELVISQSFALPWTYAANHRAIKAQTVAEDLRTQVVRQDILLAAKTLCIEIIGLDRTLSIIGHRLDMADSVLVLCERRLENGDATALDIARVKLERMTVQSEQIETLTARAKAMQALQALNGNVPLSFVDVCLPMINHVPDKRDYNPVGIDSNPVVINPNQDVNIYNWLVNHNLCNVDTCMQSMVRNDVRYCAAQSETEAARRRERAVASSVLPTLAVGYRRNTEGSLSSHGVLVGASLPIFSNRKRRRIARSRREEAELQAYAVEAEIVRERANLVAELRQAAAKLAVVDTSLVCNSLALLGRSLDAGQISLVDYFQQAAPLYGLLQDAIATSTVMHQTLAAFHRNDL